MALSFPNRSRSFDGERNAVRFVGHDGMFEVPFFVEAAALAGDPRTSGSTEAAEASHLAAFDVARGLIYRAATAAYSRGRRPTYVLTEADLRSA